MYWFLFRPTVIGWFLLLVILSRIVKGEAPAEDAPAQDIHDLKNALNALSFQVSSLQNSVNTLAAQVNTLQSGTAKTKSAGTRA